MDFVESNEIDARTLLLVRSSSYAHTECVFAMMVAGSGKSGNNPCAVCRPSP